MSRYTAQVVYPDFAEIFEVMVKRENLDVKLLEVSKKRTDTENILTLDLSESIKRDYSVFPFKDGDLVLIQVKNVFILSGHKDKDTFWMKFEAQEIFDYIFENPLVDAVFSSLGETKNILLNSTLSDFIRNDYSYSDLNKRVKYAKVSILMQFINSHLEDRKFSRIILDETLLGDIEIDHVATAFRYLDTEFIGLIKINNIVKIISLLERDKIIDSQFNLVEDAFFINKLNERESVHLVFTESGVKFNYQVEPNKNYVFELGEREFTISIGKRYKKCT